MKNLLVIILLAHAFCAFGQDSTSVKKNKGRLLIGPYATGVSIQNFSKKYGLGVSYEFVLGRNFGFGGVAAGGPDYAEFSSAILGILGLALADNADNPLLWIVLFGPLIIENPTYHFHGLRNHDLALSVNLLKFRYIYEKNSFYAPDDLFASGSVSLRFTLFDKNAWQWSLFAEATKLYYGGSPAGLQFGIAFRHMSRGE